MKYIYIHFVRKQIIDCVLARNSIIIKRKKKRFPPTPDTILYSILYIVINHNDFSQRLSYIINMYDYNVRFVHIVRNNRG